MEEHVNQVSQPIFKEHLSRAPLEPDPACEKEVPYFIEDFTLSGGCCADGLTPPSFQDTKKAGTAFESDKLSTDS